MYELGPFEVDLMYIQVVLYFVPSSVVIVPHYAFKYNTTSAKVVSFWCHLVVFDHACHVSKQ